VTSFFPVGFAAVLATWTSFFALKSKLFEVARRTDLAKVEMFLNISREEKWKILFLLFFVFIFVVLIFVQENPFCFLEAINYFFV